MVRKKLEKRLHDDGYKQAYRRRVEELLGEEKVEEERVKG